MNNIYLYNGEFSSLMSLIYALLKEDNVIIKEEKNYENDLFSIPVYLKTNNSKILENKLDKKVLNFIKYAFLSDNKNKEIIIYEFIKEALKYNNNVFKYRNIDCVNEVINMASYVRREAHRMKGFLRFKKMKNNFYYAEMSPTNNIISILANHFKKRLELEYFIIKDVKRGLYALYDKKKIYYLRDNEIVKLNLDLDKNESELTILWKTFFNTVAIKERKNLKCQMNFMPKKYWKYMTEMEEKNEKGS